MSAMLIFEIRQKHPLAVDKAKHQCVKLEPLEHWMAEHSFGAFEQGLLVHPIYGKNAYEAWLWVLKMLIYRFRRSIYRREGGHNWNRSR